MAIMEAGRLDGRALSLTSGFCVDFINDWKLAETYCSANGCVTPFQHLHWLGAWYSAFSDAEPVIAVIGERLTRQPIALIPLIRRMHHGVRVVEFADLNVTDYNAPILAAGVSLDASSSRALCQALVAALRKLPGNTDLIRLRKMPVMLHDRPNPLALLGRAGPCSLNSNLILIGNDFKAYRASIKRMQLPRSWRVFSRHPGAAFRLIDSVDEALKIIEVADAQQLARMKKLGLPFVLSDETHGAFYRDLVKRGLREGFAVVAALTCDEGVVATALGIRQDDSFVFLRISNGGKRWANCSPSRLIIERTMAALHEKGVRQFDLSIGNYPFKRRFGAVRIPLLDASIALTWRGTPYALRDLAAQCLRRHPRLAALISRLLRKQYPRADE